MASAEPIDEELDQEASALLATLPTLADEIVVQQAAQDERFAQRLAMFRRLTELGVTQSRIAEAAKVTPMAVSYALGAEARKAKGATKATKRSPGARKSSR